MEVAHLDHRSVYFAAHVLSDSASWLQKLWFLYCIVFIHFYSAGLSMSLSEVLPTTAIDAVSEFTRQSAIGNCK